MLKLLKNYDSIQDSKLISDLMNYTRVFIDESPLDTYNDCYNDIDLISEKFRLEFVSILNNEFLAN